MNTLTYYVPFCNKKFAFIDSFISFDDNLFLFSTRGYDFRKCGMKRQKKRPSARRSVPVGACGEPRIIITVEFITGAGADERCGRCVDER